MKISSPAPQNHTILHSQKSPGSAVLVSQNSRVLYAYMWFFPQTVVTTLEAHNCLE